MKKVLKALFINWKWAEEIKKLLFKHVKYYELPITFNDHSENSFLFSKGKTFHNIIWKLKVNNARNSAVVQVRAEKHEISHRNNIDYSQSDIRHLVLMDLFTKAL